MRKASSTEAIRRGFFILGSLNSNFYIPIRTIHQRCLEEGFNVSLRTVERDMNLLSEAFHFMVDVNKRSKPYGYKLPRNHRKFSGMTPIEAVTLQLAFNYLSPLLPNRTLDPINPYLKEAEAVLKERSAYKLKNWKTKVLTQYEGLQLQPAKIDSNVLNSIHLAIWEGMSIKATYLSKKKIDQSKKSNTPSKFVLHPGGLVYRGRVCYLVCSFDKDLNKIIYLPLHRFKRIEVLDEPSFHADKNIKELSSGLLGFQLSQKKIKVVLKFTMFAGTHLYESPLSENQKISKTKDGFLVVKDELIDDMELRFWIRGFGDQVEVMKPEKLRKEFMAMISRMGKKYE